MKIDWRCLDCEARGTHEGDADPTTDYDLARVAMQEHADQHHRGADQPVAFMVAAGEPASTTGGLELQAAPGGPPAGGVIAASEHTDSDSTLHAMPDLHWNLTAPSDGGKATLLHQLRVLMEMVEAGEPIGPHSESTERRGREVLTLMFSVEAEAYERRWRESGR